MSFDSKGLVVTIFRDYGVNQCLFLVPSPPVLPPDPGFHGGSVSGGGALNSSSESVLADGAAVCDGGGVEVIRPSLCSQH